MLLKQLRIFAIWYENTAREFYFESKLRILAALAKRGHTVRCLSYTGTSEGPAYQFRTSTIGPRFKRETILIRRIVPVLSLFVFNFIASIRLLSTIVCWDAIILDPNTIWSSLPIALVRHLRNGMPLLILRLPTSPVPIDKEGAKPPSFWIRAQYAVAIRFAAKCFDKVFFNSPMFAQLSSNQLRVPSRKIGVWPACVDLHTFHWSSTIRSEASRLRAELGLRGRIGVLYHGQITKGRGISELAAAFKLLKREGIAATLVLVGPGEYAREINRYVQDNNLEDTVKVLAPVTYSEVPNFIAACDVGIVPLPDNVWWRHQSPLKLLEYLAMNSPVIVSNLPAHRWILGRSNIAIYLSGTSPQEIAQGIRDFLGSRHKLKPEHGRKLVAGFSANAMSEMVEDEIHSLIVS